MNIIIRHAIVDDLQSLRVLALNSFVEAFREHNPDDIIQDYVENTFSPEQILSEFLDTLNDFFIADEDKRMRGYLKLRKGTLHESLPEGKPLEIERLYTDPDCKGQGIGKALLETAVTKALQGDFTHVWLGVWEHNSLAIKFYEREGFVRTGGQKTFMMGDDPQVDLVMVKALK